MFYDSWNMESVCRSADIFIMKYRLNIILLLPRPTSALESEVVVGLWAGEAVAPTVDWGGGLDVIRGVTTEGEPGPRSIRLSSVASFNI